MGTPFCEHLFTSRRKLPRIPDGFTLYDSKGFNFHLKCFIQERKLSYAQSEPDQIFTWKATTPLLILDLSTNHFKLVKLLSEIITTEERSTCLKMFMWVATGWRNWEKLLTIPPDNISSTRRKKMKITSHSLSCTVKSHYSNNNSISTQTKFFGFKFAAQQFTGWALENDCEQILQNFCRRSRIWEETYPQAK